MKRSFPEKGFYGILTDPAAGYEALAGAMVEAGVPVIQLRMKKAPRREVLRVAKSLRRIIPPEILFILNDDPILAREAGADGVHLGREDPGIEEAREILGEDAVYGLSTHGPDQAREALEKGPDYIGSGPVYPTPTKERPDPVIGIEGLRETLALSKVPVAAIGGIGPGNVREVLRAGARMFAAVRWVNRSPRPLETLLEIREILEEIR